MCEMYRGGELVMVWCEDGGVLMIGGLSGWCDMVGFGGV